MPKFLHALLYTTSLSPLLLVLGLVKYSTHGLDLEVIAYWSAFACLTILTFLLIWWVHDNGETMPITLKKIKPSDSSFLKYFVSYSIPGVLKVVGIDFDSIRIFFIVIFLIGWSVLSVPFHPILRLFGYKFYEIETDDGFVLTLITRSTIRQVMPLKNCIRIAENLFYERREK